MCQQRARLISNWLCTITAGQSRHSFEQFVRAIRSEVFFPLSFPFPRSLGITGAQLQKIAFCVLLAHLGRFFRLSNCACKMTSKKHRKKCENQGFWPPKTLPKSCQNRRPKKHAIFHRFLLDVFLFFNLRFLENRGFPIGKSLISRFSIKSCFHKFNIFLVQKTYQKPLQNDVRTLQKSMSQTCCFSTSIFSGFGLDFGASWASNLEPSWLQNAFFSRGDALF